MGLTKLRRRPVCFKLRETLYIAGGHDNCTSADNCNPSEIRKDCIQKKYIRCNPVSYNDEETERNICFCCDKYNLVESKYYRNVHSMPSVAMASRQISNVVTDEEEQFAVIAPCQCETNENQNMIMFTEDNGFEEFPNFSSKRGKNVEWNHPRIRAHFNVLLQVK